MAESKSDDISSNFDRVHRYRLQNQTLEQVWQLAYGDECDRAVARALAEAHPRSFGSAIMTNATVDVLYQNFEEALVNVLIGNKGGFAGRNALWKARAAALSNPEYDQAAFDRLVLGAQERAAQLWRARGHQ